MVADSFSARQKLAQFVIIWLLPVVGGLLVLHFANESSHELSQFKNYANSSVDTYPGPQQKLDSGSDGTD